MRSFSPRAEKVIILAQDEARKNGSSTLLPEHVMLALVKNGEGLGFEIFTRLQLEAANFQLLLERSLINENAMPTLNKIGYSRRYQTMIDIAKIEANALKNDYIGTEHLVLACVRESGSLTAKFFNEEKITITDVRMCVMTIQNQML